MHADTPSTPHAGRTGCEFRLAAQRAGSLATLLTLPYCHQAQENIVYGNGASLTNRPRPDGSSPLTVIINRAGSTAEAVTTTTTTTTPTTTATTGQRCSAVRQAGAAIQRCARAGSEARAAALQLSATIQRSGAAIQRSRAAIQRSARTRSEARAAINRATHQLNGIHTEGVPRARSVGTRNTSQPGSHWRNVNQRRDRQNTLRGTILRASRAEDASEIPRMELRLRKAFIDGFLYGLIFSHK